MANFPDDMQVSGLLRVLQQVSAAFFSWGGPNPTAATLFTPSFYAGTIDPSVDGFPASVGSLFLGYGSTLNVWIKWGAGATDWSPIGNGSPSGGTQSFFYTATGSEGASFTVTLPSARADTNYGVVACGQGLADVLMFDVPDADKATTHFTCVATAAPSANDKIYFLVEELS